MEKKIFILIGVIAAIAIIVFSVFWYRNSSKSPEEVLTTTPSPPTIQENEPQPAGQKLPPIPEDFAEFHDNNSEMRADFKQKTTAQFHETVKNIQEAPNSVWAWLTLGTIKKEFNDYKGAESAWLYATQLYQEHKPAYANLAQLYWHALPNYPKAEAMFLTVIKLDIADTAAYRDLSDLYRYNYKAKTDQADKILLRGLSDNPKSSDLLSHLAVYYEETGKLDLAIKYFEELLEVAPANTKAAVEQELADLKKKQRQ